MMSWLTVTRGHVVADGDDEMVSCCKWGFVLLKEGVHDDDGGGGDAAAAEDDQRISYQQMFC